MHKIHFFYDDDLIELELKINDWLERNRQVKIVESNLNSLGKPSGRAGIVNTEKYVFYILYSDIGLDAPLPVPALEEDIPIDVVNEHLKSKQQAVSSQGGAYKDVRL